MPVTLPIEFYEIFEKGFGKEDARTVVKTLEAVIGNEVVNKWHQTKEELKTELLKEVATKSELENVRLELVGKINELYARMEKDKAELLGVMKQDKAELLGRMEKDKAELLGIMKQDKAELLGRMEKDKAELLGIMKQDKAELLGRIEQDKAELLGKIETEITRLDRKFTIMFVILFFTIVFLNQNALEFLAKVFGLVR